MSNNKKKIHERKNFTGNVKYMVKKIDQSHTFNVSMNFKRQLAKDLKV